MTVYSHGVLDMSFDKLCISDTWYCYSVYDVISSPGQRGPTRTMHHTAYGNLRGGSSRSRHICSRLRSKVRIKLWALCHIDLVGRGFLQGKCYQKWILKIIFTQICLIVKSKYAFWKTSIIMLLCQVKSAS